MIPNNEWSSLAGAAEPYPVFDRNRPTDVPRIHAVSIGPIALNASAGSLISRYWLVTQDINGNVVIAGAN